LFGIKNHEFGVASNCITFVPVGQLVKNWKWDTQTTPWWSSEHHLVLLTKGK